MVEDHNPGVFADAGHGNAGDPCRGADMANPKLKQRNGTAIDDARADAFRRDLQRQVISGRAMPATTRRAGSDAVSPLDAVPRVTESAAGSDG
jgi:hypothetical protein